MCVNKFDVFIASLKIKEMIKSILKLHINGLAQLLQWLLQIPTFKGTTFPLYKKFGNETIDNDRLLEIEARFYNIFGSEEIIHIVWIFTNLIKGVGGYKIHPGFIWINVKSDLMDKVNKRLFTMNECYVKHIYMTSIILTQ